MKNHQSFFERLVRKVAVLFVEPSGFSFAFARIQEIVSVFGRKPFGLLYDQNVVLVFNGFGLAGKHVNVQPFETQLSRFEKSVGINADLASANQDRITNSVWITRGNNGGQIFNANTETSANKDASPEGTMWAEGDIANAANLNFRPFRAAVGSPKDVVGKNLILFIPADNVMMTVHFTEWSTGRAGGFAYMRSTP